MSQINEADLDLSGKKQISGRGMEDDQFCKSKLEKLHVPMLLFSHCTIKGML